MDQDESILVEELAFIEAWEERDIYRVMTEEE